LWRWYINITITILDIIHRLVFYLKQRSGFCLHLQMEPAELGLISLLIDINISVVAVVGR
jgi:hypothetical protein